MTRWGFACDWSQSVGPRLRTPWSAMLGVEEDFKGVYKELSVQWGREDMKTVSEHNSLL